jgi:hypothetical protein
LARLVPAVGGPSPLDGRPSLKQISDALSAHPAASKVVAEMGAAMAEAHRGR